MKTEFRKMDVPLVDSGEGLPLAVERFEEKTLQFSGTFVSDMSVQGLMPQGDWVNLIATVTAPGWHRIPETCQAIRIRATNYTSGTPIVIFGGLDSRSD